MNYNIYFSPTGGTKRVADCLVHHLQEEYKPIDLSKEIEPMQLHSDDICLISVPSYGGRVPTVNLERIKKISGNGARAILNCVYGNRHWDDTLTELQDTLETLGFVCVAAIAAVAEHSVFRQFGEGRPDENDKAQLAEFAVKIQHKLDKSETGRLELIGNHGIYKDFRGVPFKPEANESCMSCGLCAKECPANAIPVDNPNITDKEICISCMRCIRNCPVHARTLNVELMKVLEEKMAPVLSGYKKNYLYL